MNEKYDRRWAIENIGIDCHWQQGRILRHGGAYSGLLNQIGCGFAYLDQFACFVGYRKTAKRVNWRRKTEKIHDGIAPHF